MENHNDKKQFINSEGESIDHRKELYNSNVDNFTFVPIENILIIEKVINNWEEVKKLWKKMQQPSPQSGDFLSD